MKILLSVFCISLSAFSLSAQSEGISIQQNPKFSELLDNKRKINISLSVDDHYKIQIFYGDNSDSVKALSNFKKEFSNLDGTIVFNTPVYKVWIGNFKTRIEAERNLALIQNKYPNALLIKPKQ